MRTPLTLAFLESVDLTVLYTQTALLNRYWEHRVLSPRDEAISLRERVLGSILEEK